MQRYGKGGRDALPHYLPYIKLLRAALLKLPPVTNTSVYSGKRLPLQTVIRNAAVGQKVVWWGFTSTSRELDTLQNVNFLGSGAAGAVGVGERTVFRINSNGGRDVAKYSMFSAAPFVSCSALHCCAFLYRCVLV